MKAVITYDEAKQKLVELFQAKNPDITEVQIEGMLSIKDVNKILQEEKGKVTSITSTGSVNIPSDEIKPGDMISVDQQIRLPTPIDPDMIALVRSLQTVVETDNGKSWNIKWLRGKNTGMIYELSKELVITCEYCGYIGMDNNDVDSHKNTYHKAQVEAIKAIEKEQLQIAREKQKKAVQEKLDSGKSPGWGKGSG